MHPEIDFFSYPGTLGDLKRTWILLRNQIKILEALEHAKDRLQKVQILESNTLSKCKVFISYVNQADPQSNFFSEVSQLDLNELAFASICFEDRRLRTLLDSFKASYIQKYVGKEGIACLDRSEIFTRIKNVLMECKDSQFDLMYLDLVRSNARSAEPGLQVVEAGTSSLRSDPPPLSAAQGSDVYEFLGAPWENVKNMFGAQIANALNDLDQQPSPKMKSVLARYPQLKGGGDALVCLDCRPDAGLVFELFRNDERDTTGARVADIAEVFGSRIANAIEKSDLRKWERRNGHLDRTSCVKMACQVQLRVCYDTGIANVLYSHD